MKYCSFDVIYLYMSNIVYFKQSDNAVPPE